MNCFLNIRPRVAVPSNSFLEISKPTSDPSLRHNVPSASESQQMELVRQAQAAAALLAERHMSSAQPKRAAPQVGNSTILQHRYMSPSPLLVGRSGRQGVQRLQPKGQVSQEQHQANQGPQQRHVQMARQQHRTGPETSQLSKQHDGESHPRGKAVNKGDICIDGNSATTSRACGQHARQRGSPVGCGNLPFQIQQMHQLKGVYTGSSTHETSSYQSYPEASEWTKTVTSDSPGGVLRVITSGDWGPANRARSSSLQQHEGSCPQQPSHIAAARQSTTTDASHHQPGHVNSNCSDGDGSISRGKRTGLASCLPDSSGWERFCRSPFAAASASPDTARPKTILMPEASATDPSIVAPGINLAAVEPAGVKKLVLSQAAFASTSGKATRDDSSAARSGVSAAATESMWGSSSSSSPAQRQQLHAGHRSIQAFGDVAVDPHSRVAYLPPQHKNESSLTSFNDGPRDRDQPGRVVAQGIVEAGSLGAHAVGDPLFREAQINGAAVGLNPVSFCSTRHSHARDRTEKLKQNQMYQQKQHSSACTVALQLGNSERHVACTSVQCLKPGTKLTSAPQQLAGFALGRPRTPVRVPLPQTDQHWQPQPQSLMQVQQNAQQASRIRQQVCLQRCLGKLQDQHPYKWAAAGGLGGHRSPGMVPQGVTNLSLLSGQSQCAPRSVYAPVLANTFTSMGCWQPHAPRGEGTGVLLPSDPSAVVYNRLDCIFSKSGATPNYVRRHPHGMLETTDKICKKRPTSAPPSQNGRPLEGGLGAVLYQQEAVVPSGAQFGTRRGVSWQSQSHHTLEQRHHQVGAPVSGLQTSLVTAPPAHTATDSASSLKLTATAGAACATGAGLAEAAVHGVATVTLTGINSVPTHPRPETCSVQKYNSEERLRRQFRPGTEPNAEETEVAIPVCVAATEQPSCLGSPRTEATPLVWTSTMPAPTSGANDLAAPPRDVRPLSTLESQKCMSRITGEEQTGVPYATENDVPRENLHYMTGSVTCDPTSTSTEQVEDPSTLFRQRVGVSSTSSKIICSTAIPQQHAQPQGASSTQGDPCGRTSDGTCRAEDRIGQSYELSEESARCASGTQLQERLKQQHAQGTQSRDLSEGVKHQHPQSVEKGQNRQQPARHTVISDHQREQQTRAVQKRHDMTKSTAVAFAAEKTSAIANVQQKLNFPVATGKQPSETSGGKLGSVILRKTARREQRSLSYAKPSFLASPPLAVETPVRSSSMCPLVLPRRKKDALLARDLHTSRCVPAADSHLTAQTATGDLSTAAPRDVIRRSTSVRLSAEHNVIEASSSQQETPFNFVTENGCATGKTGLRLLHRHGQRMGRSLSGERTGRCSSAVVSTDKSLDVYARSSLSTASSKDIGVGTGDRDNASKRSRECSMSRASSCRLTAGCSTKPKTRCRESMVHSSIGSISQRCSGSKRNEFSNNPYADREMPEEKTDNAEEEGPECRTAFAASENRSTDQSGGTGSDSTHAGSADNPTCGVRTNVKENPLECEGGNGRRDTQVRARPTDDSTRSETGVQAEEKVEKTRLRSITSTDVSRHTGRSTTTSNENTAIPDESNSDAYREGEEDVIPLPAFLWRSPLSLHRNSAGDPILHPETARTATGLHCCPDSFRNSLHFKQSFHNEEDELTPAAAARKCGHTEQRTSVGVGGCSETATLQMADFELADPRFGGEASLLGRGTYGVVRLMRHKPTGRLYAVKSIDKSSVVDAGMVSQVEFELLTQKNVLRHRNILRCYAFLEDVDHVHMVLEYCNGGDLYTQIRTQPQRRINEEEAFLYFAQLVNGLHYMHTRCIMHRDLKLENLLLDKNGVLKIADLGWCTTILGKRRNFNFCGTLDYLAPEMVRGDGHDWRVDLWGAGILLYEMLDGKPPFQSTRHLELVQQILKASINLPPHIPPDAGDLIQKLLQYDPEDRIPLHAICQHPWVKRMWNQLKKHYYSVYPNAAPAAFELYSPATTARQQIEDALSKSSSGRKPLVDLRDVYPKETAMTPTQRSDCFRKTEKVDKSRFPPAKDVQRLPSAVSSHVPAARDAQPNLEVAGSTAAKSGYADNAGSYSAASADAAGTPASPWETPACATCTEPTDDSVPSVPCKVLTDPKEAVEAGDRETHRSSSTSASKNRSSLQQQRGRTAAQVSKCKHRKNSNGRQPRNSSDLMAVSPLKEGNTRADGRVPKNRRESAHSLNRSEQSVPEEEETQVHLRSDGCVVASNVLWEKEKESHTLTCSAAGGDGKQSSRPTMSSRGAETSPESQAELISSNPTTVTGERQRDSPRPASVSLITTSAKAATPPSAGGRALPGLRARAPVRNETVAVPRRRSTAAPEVVLEAVRAATHEGSLSRAGNKSPGITMVELERRDSSENGALKSKVKRSTVASRRRVLQQISKIDSGLGSQKYMLMSPPIKRSALRACESWDGNTSSKKTTEQSDSDVGESPWPSAHRSERLDFTAGSQKELQQSVLRARQQQQPAQLLPSVKLANHQVTSSQTSAQPQQQHLMYCHQQPASAPNVLHQRELSKCTDTKEYHAPQLGIKSEGNLDASLEVQGQRQLQQNTAAPPPLVRNHGGKPGSATYYQPPSSHPLPSHPLVESGYKGFNESFATTAGERVQDTGHKQRIQHLQHVEAHGRAQRKQAVSPARDRQLQLHVNDSESSQTVTASQQSPVSWTAWCHHAQQQHAKQQRQLLLAKQQMANAQPAIPKGQNTQGVGQQCALLRPQQRRFQPLQQTSQKKGHSHQEEPVYELRYRQHQQPGQAQLGQLQSLQQRQRLSQDQHVSSLSAKKTATYLSCQPAQQDCASLLQEELHEEPSKQQQNQEGHRLEALRSMTPPAATTFHRNRAASTSVHTRSYHFLPQQQTVAWHAGAQAQSHFLHSSGSNVPFHNTPATQAPAPCGRTHIQSPSCAVEVDVSSQIPRARTQAATATIEEGTAVKGGTAGTVLQSHLESGLAPSSKGEKSNSASSLKEENDQSSVVTSRTRAAEACPRITEEQSKLTTPDQIACAANNTVRVRRAGTTFETPASALTEGDLLGQDQGSSPQRAGAPCDDLYAYTPRWGRTRQAAQFRSATVAPALPSPDASTDRLRSLLGISAPPRSCAAAATARRQLRNLPVPGGCEQQRQQRQQVHQTRQLIRVGKLKYADQQQHQRPQQRGKSPNTASTVARKQIKQNNRGECVPINIVDADNTYGTQRMSCFSFGYKGAQDCSQNRDTSNSDLALFSDRLSAGSVHDVGLVSQCANPPDAHSGDSPLVVPSEKARQVLNKLFEDSAPPRVLKRVVANLVERAPGTAAARSAATMSAAADEATLAADNIVAAPSTEAPLKSTAASVAPEAAVATTAVATGTTRSADPSQKTLYRHRGSSYYTRLHAQSPTRCGASTAAVAAAAAAWRARSPGKELQERKQHTELSLRGGKTVGSCKRPLLPDAVCVEHRGPDSSTRKVMHTRSQQPFHMLARSRTAGQSVASGRKTQKVSDFSARKGFSSSPRRTPQVHATTCSHKQGQGRRATGIKTQGEEGATLGASAGGTRKAADTHVELHPIKEHEQSRNSKIEGASSHISKPATCRAAAEKSPALVEKIHDERSVSPGEPNAAVCFEHRTRPSVSTCDYEFPSPSLESACEVQSKNAPLFQARLQAATAPTPNFPIPPASPSTRTGSPPKLICGQTSNAPSCLPAHRLAAPTAVAAATQQAANNRPLCPRYWSPPCRVPETSQWRSCSTGERALFGEHMMPQLLTNSSLNQLASSAISGRTGHCPTAATQQNTNASMVAGGGVVPLTSSWIARQRNVYTTRQQTPPFPAVYPAARGLRQGTPPWSGTPGGQQVPCHSLKPQVTLPVGSTSANALVYTFATATGRQLNPSQFPGALQQRWGAAVAPGISVAASAATCHVRPGPVHAPTGTGFGLFSSLYRR